MPTAIRLRPSLWIINAGKNNMPDTPAEAVVRYVGAMAHWASPRDRHVLVVGNFVDTDGADSKKIELVNDIWRKQFGARFFDLQSYVTSDAIWRDAGLFRTTEDKISAENGVLASRLSSDGHHLNTKAATAVRDRIKDIIARLGWLPLQPNRRMSQQR